MIAAASGTFQRPVNPAFPLRDAFADTAAVPSDLKFEGEDRRNPVLTIAIPTFRRGRTLAEAVRSAIEQDYDESIETIVVDNNPESRGWEELLAQIPELRRANFRYYVNRSNIGMFGNWNRCIELGRGKWHAILHDDDLFDRDFASKMLGILSDTPRLDGLISRKRTFDERKEDAGHPVRPRGPLLRAAKRLWVEAQFLGKPQRHLAVRRLFFGDFLGNPVGLMARKADLIRLGGYDPNHYPSADYYLMTRFAYYLKLGQTRETLTSIRIAENESARPEVIRGFFCKEHDVRQRLARTVVPAWWTRFEPMIVANQRESLRYDFAQEVSDEELRQLIGVRAVKNRKWLLIAVMTAMVGL